MLFDTITFFSSYMLNKNPKPSSLFLLQVVLEKKPKLFPFLLSWEGVYMVPENDIVSENHVNGYA